MSDQYFAAKLPAETAAVLEAKSQEWSQSIESNGYLEKLRSCYIAYHGAYYADTGNGHQVTFTGDQGELVNFPVNQWRNIATHMLVMTTSNRPAFQARATNTDYKSLVQTKIAEGVLDYYMREKKLDVYLKKAVEYAIVYGSGFVLLEWDANKGDVVDYIEETKTKIYEGDIVFTNLTPFDVMFDGTKEDPHDNEWIMIRRWKNKFDLAAKYPEFADEIKQVQTKSDTQRLRIGLTHLLDETSDVQILEFYHKRTESMPDGRYMMFINSNIVLQDLPMPYRELPLFRISPSDIHGTSHGYTPMFDLLPLQEQLNALYSVISTNQNAFGVQNVLVPRGTDIAVNQLAGGLNIIEYNATAGDPKPLNLTNTPAEVFKYIEMIQDQMQILSGVNSVARGAPEASLKSGTALALVQSMALQFMSGLQQSYVDLIENSGTAIIKILQDFALSPRIIAIAGKSSRSEMKEFRGKDISSISRVVVDVGNPLSKTTAGRVQMAQELLQYQSINADQYISLIKTGNLDSITEDIVKEQLLMKGENEALIEGDTPLAVFTENHKMHIDYHRSVLFDPQLKKDADLVNRVQSHIQEHIELLRNTDPQILAMMNQQPLPKPAPPTPPQNSGVPQQMMPPQQGFAGVQVQGNQIQGPGLPPTNLPNLPKVSPQLLPNPTLQQQSLKNVK